MAQIGYWTLWDLASRLAPRRAHACEIWSQATPPSLSENHKRRAFRRSAQLYRWRPDIPGGEHLRDELVDRSRVLQWRSQRLLENHLAKAVADALGSGDYEIIGRDRAGSLLVLGPRELWQLVPDIKTNELRDRRGAALYSDIGVRTHSAGSGSSTSAPEPTEALTRAAMRKKVRDEMERRAKAAELAASRRAEAGYIATWAAGLDRNSDRHFTSLEGIRTNRDFIDYYDQLKTSYPTVVEK
jgi:hypothetical protein